MGIIALRALCLVALTSVGWLLLATVAVGLVTGWDSSVIVSGSMRPAVQVGDVLLSEAPGDDPLTRGAVVTLRRDDGHLVSHRVVGVFEDGTLQTRGDANSIADSDLVHPDQVEGVGRMVIPFVGLPQVWIAEGRWSSLLLLGLGLAATTWGALVLHRPPVSEPAHLRRGRRRRGEHFAPRRRPPSGVVRPAIASLLLIALIGLVVNLEVGHATFMGHTGSIASTWGSAPSFCTAAPVTVRSTADAWVRQDQANSAFGIQTTMQVQSRNGNRNRRALVRFVLPSAPSRCVLASATLRVFANGSTAGRTVQVQAASATWTEAVTWNTQPAVGGALASAGVGTGWRTWNVSTIVTGQYLGTNRGLVLRDAVESSGSAATQTYQTREGTNDPELVLTWQAAP